MERSRASVLLALGAALLVLAAGCGRTSDAGPSDDELDKIVKEIDRVAPVAGLGEAAPPPPDSSLWETDFSKALVPLDEFKAGGPPKDGIPAIDEPRFTRVPNVDFLNGPEPLIAVTVGNETRGYPLQILLWHEIVNDQIGEIPVAVTFCPLCNTAIVFDRRLEGETYSFGTTGKLRESDLVMYDRTTESWWQQFGGRALVGELAGKKLRQLPARIMSWDDFRSAYSQSLVLNRFTGFARQYGANPYAGYDDVDSPPFYGVGNADDDRLPPKERVVYVEVGEHAFAIPFSALEDQTEIEISTDAGKLVVRWQGGVASALDARSISRGRDVGAADVLLDGKRVPFNEPFWFAVAAFRPDIEIVDG